MPPSQQSPSVGKLATSPTSSPSEVSLELKQQHVRGNKLRRSARLVEMVNGLQKSMEAMLAKRKYYAKRSVELEQALTERAPEALYKSLTISTITVADIMMELEDLHDKTTALEGQVRNLQQRHDLEKNDMQRQFEDLERQYELLEQQSWAKQDELKTKLAEANEEVTTIQKKYARTRKEYHTCTRNIAMMASKIATVQRENNSLRVEADTSHRALIEMEQKVDGLQSVDSNKTHSQQQNHMIRQLQLQLEASRFENEKLIAERTANHSVINELQNQVRMLQTERTEQHIRGDDDMLRLPFRPMFPVQSSDLSRSLPFHTTELLDDTDSAPSNLDNLLTIVRSMSSQSSSASTEVAANTSRRYEENNAEDLSDDSAEDEYDPYQDAGRSSRNNNDSPNMVRRLHVNINGLEGSYTGPVSSNGLPNGTGTIRFKNGDTYLGVLKDGQLHGKGAMYYASNRKSTFRGTFVHNNPVM